MSLTIIGNCTQDDIIDELFGSVSHFACMVEELGDEFQSGSIKVTYDTEQDIHTFIRIK